MSDLEPNSNPQSGNPKVSVVIPVYNKRELISSTLRSVLNQTFNDCEIIVVDDGSTDGSAEVLEGFGSKIRYHLQDNGGPSVARNTGVSLAGGEYVAFLDADDRWEPNKLEMQMAFFGEHPDLAWGACNYVNCDELGESRELARKGLSGDWTVYDNWFETNTGRYMILTSGVIVRRDLLAQVGTFDTSIPAGQDMDLWARIARVEPRYAYCNLPLFDYLHITNSVSKPSWKKFDSNTKFIEKHVPLTIQANDPKYSEFIRVETNKLIKATLSHGMSDLTKRLIDVSPSEWRSSTTFRLMAKLPPSMLKLISKVYRTKNAFHK